MSNADRAATSPRSSRWLLVTTAGLLVIVVATLAQVAPRPRIPHFAAHTPSVIAHGGAQGHAPGNTLEAFRLALDMGADTLEMDLQLTADREVVVFHDATLDRTTDGRGAVADRTLAQLRELDAGYSFAAADGSTPYRDQGVRIPTFEEVLEAFPDIFLIVEMKPDGGPGIVQAVAERIDARDAQDRTAVASFSLDHLEEFRDALPGVPTNMPEGETTAFYVRHLVGLHRWWSPPGELFQVPEVHEGRQVVTPRFVSAANRLGVDVQVWTVNEPEDMRRLLDAGVHGIMTDYPDRLVAVIAEREQARPEVGAPHEAGLALARTLRERFGWLDGIMLAVTRLGDVEFYLAFFPLVYWSLDRRLGLRLGVALLLSAGINAIGKLATLSPRPLFLDPALARVTEPSFGIPSGHAQNAVAVWGLLAAELGGRDAPPRRRRAVWAAATLLIALIGWSRVHLGAHFLIDVLSGWALGALIVVAYLRLEGPVRRWLIARSAREQVLAALAASLALVAAGALLAAGRLGFAFPEAWVGAGDAAEAVSVADVVRAAGALFGAGVGVVGLRARGGFDSEGPPAKRLLRYLVGIVGVGLLWVGLGALLPSGTDPLSMVIRYLRYALVGTWITGVAPLLFLRLGIAVPEAAPGRATSCLGQRAFLGPGGGNEDAAPDPEQPS